MVSAHLPVATSAMSIGRARVRGRGTTRVERRAASRRVSQCALLCNAECAVSSGGAGSGRGAPTWRDSASGHAHPARVGADGGSGCVPGLRLVLTAVVLAVTRVRHHTRSVLSCIVGVRNRTRTVNGIRSGQSNDESPESSIVRATAERTRRRRALSAAVPPPPHTHTHTHNGQWGWLAPRRGARGN